eukprot:gnl/MRDRNA2_/MRDRNA2_109361_c0_seq1.p1 gnl/MRDRNA2_/MRDRNA2_109361_c0~~gnl/MRDRNA2_/MRDRNA2_109361_c0_seq1.p1  ORF type:complete len:376 (+),score=64.01 gnl/MRDRNA2_/MRDRNA2_109361_c0_seq1:186-1313(+)
MKSQFTWLEYEGLTLCLGIVICLSLGFVEIGVARFQVLPLMFPGMFEVRQRRMLCYNFDITEGRHGKRIRSAAKAMLRLNVFVVLSYLWQHCVLETQQIIDNKFPAWHCSEGFDCFTTDLHYETLLQPTMQHPSLDCANPHQKLPDDTVISCVRFVPPSAAEWLMHIAISHSLSQLNIQTFQLLVWIAGASKLLRRLLMITILMFILVFASLFFAGVISAFATSWLSFVLCFSFPLFIGMVVQAAIAMDKVHVQETEKAQRVFEGHLTDAVQDIEEMFGPSQFPSFTSLEGNDSNHGSGDEEDTAQDTDDTHQMRRPSKTLQRLQTSIRQVTSSLYPRRFSLSKSASSHDIDAGLLVADSGMPSTLIPLQSEQQE